MKTNQCYLQRADLTGVLQFARRASGDFISTFELGTLRIMLRLGKALPLYYVFIAGKDTNMKEKQIDQVLASIIEGFEGHITLEQVKTWDGNIEGARGARITLIGPATGSVGVPVVFTVTNPDVQSSESHTSYINIPNWRGRQGDATCASGEVEQVPTDRPLPLSALHARPSGRGPRAGSADPPRARSPARGS